MPMIAAVLAERETEIGALDLLAVTTGPGGFTGLRIGLAAAEGLAIASGVPLLGISCFEAIAGDLLPAAAARPLVVALETKREELYLQSFAPEPGAAAMVAPADWSRFVPKRPFLAGGDGAARLAAALRRDDMALAPGAGFVDAAAVARVALARWRRGERPSAIPLYLRAPDTTTPRVGPRSAS